MRCERPQSSISRPGSADGDQLAQVAQVAGSTRRGGAEVEHSRLWS